MPIEGGADKALSFDTEREKRIKELEAKVEADRFDRMTGLSGGDHLMPKLEDLVKELNSSEHEGVKNMPSKIMVIAMDMNRLKFFNDTYGHTGGNKALIAFANRLRTVFKDVDFIFRPKGADEFTVLLQILKEDADSKKIFERIKEAINTDLSINLNGKDFLIAAAIGYTVVEKGETRNTTDILHDADLEMYKDKEKMKKEEKSVQEDYSI